MSDKEQDEKKEKSKRQADSNESNDEEEKRSTRKKARVDYNEEKKGEAANKKETSKTEEDEEIIEDDDDDEIQEVTPTNVKSKPEETSNTTADRPTRSSSDDLMGLPMEPTGLEGAGMNELRNFMFHIPYNMLLAVDLFTDYVLYFSIPKQSSK